MDYTITGNFILPSKGKIYTPEIDPEVTLRTMTTAEEMKRMSSSDYPYKVMSNIIADCMVSGPDLSPYDMCLGDYLFLMYKLREVTYGSSYNLETRCPFCNTRNTDTIDLKDLIIKEYDPVMFRYMEFELPQTHKKIKIKFQTPRMLDSTEEKIRHHRKKSVDKSSNPELIYTISNMIEEIDGEIPNVLDVEKWVPTLPMMDTQAILSAAEIVNNVIGIDRGLEVTCDICKMSYEATFRIGPEFFRPTVDPRRK